MSELSPEARDLIECAAHADDPSLADRERMRRRLAAKLGVGALMSGAVAGSGGVVSASASTGSLSAKAGAGMLKGSGLPGLLKVAAAAGLASAIGGSVLWLVRETPSPKAPAPAASAARELEPEAAPLPSVSAAEPAPVAQLPPAPGLPVVESLAAPPPEQAVAPTVLRAAAPLAPSSAPRRARSAHAPVANNGNFSAELSLLAAAQAALSEGAPRKALALIGEYGTRFPRGVLDEERLGIEALARCELGEDAKGALAELARRAPTSPLLARVRAACGER